MPVGVLVGYRGWTEAERAELALFPRAFVATTWKRYVPAASVNG